MTSSLSRQNLGFDFESPVYRFGPLQTTASNALCVPIIYGQVKAAGNKIWQGAGSKTFYALIAFGEGPISGISNVKINDYVVPSKDLPGCAITAYVGDGTKDIYSEVTGANNKPLADNAARAAIVAAPELRIKSLLLQLFFISRRLKIFPVKINKSIEIRDAGPWRVCCSDRRRRRRCRGCRCGSGARRTGRRANRPGGFRP